MHNTPIFLQLLRDAGLPLPVAEYKFHPTRRWKLDYAFVDHKLALEVEGGVWIIGRHQRPKGFLKDMEKYSEAAIAGWCVIRVTPKELCTQKTIELITRALASR